MEGNIPHDYPDLAPVAAWTGNTDADMSHYPQPPEKINIIVDKERFLNTRNAVCSVPPSIKPHRTASPQKPNTRRAGRVLMRRPGRQ